MKKNLTKKSLISIFLVLLITITGVSYMVIKNNYIGDYKIVVTNGSQNGPTIGKQVSEYKILESFSSLDELTKNNKNFTFFEELNPFKLSKASHISYYDLETKKNYNSWEFRFENNEDNSSFVITTYPPINNPVYLKTTYNPRKIKIGNTKILVVHPKEEILGVLLNSEKVDLSSEKNTTAPIWIDAINLSEDKIITITKLFI